MNTGKFSLSRSFNESKTLRKTKQMKNSVNRTHECIFFEKEQDKS
ncbi:hypothetical protein LEP1GSC125_3506 [Leptospira mayottensis 200901122]|uniref:Uncharacterized protein n=1 Tax=Leptospira mayottensis 200901122 TaxID=1193010 RepID=A0AA87MMG6_9LEPT|nr:hypothetical protein LEP1GSC125_3506 [Leptospira mayottensis 200901122]